MPPAFLFPESDPPPSDLVPEQYLSSATSSLSSTSLSSSLLGGNESRNGENGLRSADTVDAAPLIHPHQKGGSQLGIEEYTLPDLFPTSGILNGESNFMKQSPNSNPALSPNHNKSQYPSALLLSHGQTHPATNINYSNNNNYQEPSPLHEVNTKAAKFVPTSPGPSNGNTYEPNYNPFNGQQETDPEQVAVMRVQLDRRSPALILEDEFPPKPKQPESPGM